MNCPETGKEFELVLSADQCDPNALLCIFGYGDNALKYIGNKVKPSTIKCKLVEISPSRDLCAVNKKLKYHEPRGEISDIQFFQPFLAKYPIPGGNSPVGIANNSLALLQDDTITFFPYVDNKGKTYLGGANGGVGICRWIVIIPGNK